MGNIERDDLGKVLGATIKQQRVMIPLTLWELDELSGVSMSHLARIERGERFPSARILRKIAENDTSNLGDTSTLADPSVVDQLIEKQ